MHTPTSRSLALLACLALAIAFGVQGFAFVRANAQTFDEGAHITAGYSFLARRDFRLYREHPPLIRELCALPLYLGYRLPFEPDERLWREAEMWAISQKFLHESPVPPREILTAARLPNLVLGVALVGLAGWWAYRLWGPRAAVVATALAAFEPNLVAHAALVGTDLGITLFTFLTVYLLWEYGRARSVLVLAGAGLALGLALTAKFSGMLTAAMVGVVLAGHVLPGRSLLWPDVKAPWARRLGQAAVFGGVVAAGAALVFVPVYFGQGFAPFVYGVQWQMSKLGLGHPGFLIGDYSDHGWFGYFPVAFAIKTPLGSLALVAAGLLLFRAGEPLRGRDAFFLLLPVVAFAAAVARGRVDVGVRYLLPIYPFLFVLASRLVTARGERPRLTAALVGLALMTNAASVLRVAPHHLAYFNEAVGGPAQGHLYLSDSNIDWGQGLIALKEYMDREQVPMVYLSYFGTARPEGYGVRYQEAPAGSPVVWPPRPTEELPPGERELFAISVTCLQGTYFEDKTTYRWLWEREPVARPGYCIFVYDLTGDADAHRRLAEVYQRHGQGRLAEAERRRARLH